MLVERHVFHADLGETGGEGLLRWCRERGADSFSFTVIGSPPELEQHAAQIESPLQPYLLPVTTVRAVPGGQPGSYWTKPAVLWTLNETTERILLGCFPMGLLTYVPTEQAWCEDPCLYRRDELMLGVISHEHEGILRIEASEQLALDQADLAYRLGGEWVGY
ncbi:MAG: hypothetical protein U0164_03795 [Gemmatimonadaceae bacterium]